MHLFLCALPLFYAKLVENRLETAILIFHKVQRLFLFLLSCIVTPCLKLQYFKKRKRLPAINNPLLLTSASEIARRIRRKEVTSDEVIRAYIERCKQVNPILNAIVETRFENALKEARKIDKFLSNTTKTEEQLELESPLLGVPITVKESIAVQGMSNAAGVKKKGLEKANEDAVVVGIVRNAGAIVILVSNTPELCLFWESNNRVTGSTLNPYDTRRTAGGSSGGEAALLSSGASVLSLSSDIAGSSRFPAMVCGIYGHKPSPGLVPHKGHNPSSNCELWPQYFTIGTMVRYAEDLSLMLKTITEEATMKQRLNEKVSLKDIKFYYLEDCCGMTNSISKDVKIPIERLRSYIEMAYGVKVQKAHLSDMKFAYDVAVYTLLEMNVEDVEKQVKVLGSCKIWLELLKTPFHLSPYALSTIAYGSVKWLASKLPKSYGKKILEKKASLKKQFEDLLGDDGVLIYPTFVSASYYHHQSYTNSANFTYMMLYNVLGLPVTQCPMGLNKNGLPVGLQIISNAGNDHLTIAVAQEIEKAFGGWQAPPSIKSEV